MRSFFWYLIAAAGEIGGCFSFWAWLRMHKSPLWTVPGIAALIAFALALTRIDSSHAGRAYAAYGGVSIPRHNFCPALVRVGRSNQNWNLSANRRVIMG